MINVNKVNKTLLHIKSSWEQFLCKYLCDHCEQSEQNPFKYQKLLEQFLPKYLCDQCEHSEQNPFKYQNVLGTILKNLSNIRRSWEQFLTKFLSD